MGKGCRTPVSLPPGEKAGTFLGPEALSAPRQPGRGGLLSRGAELRSAPAPWCVESKQNGPDASPAAPLSEGCSRWR